MILPCLVDKHRLLHLLATIFAVSFGSPDKPGNSYFLFAGIFCIECGTASTVNLTKRVKISDHVTRLMEEEKMKVNEAAGSAGC